MASGETPWSPSATRSTPATWSTSAYKASICVLDRRRLKPNLLYVQQVIELHKRREKIRFLPEGGRRLQLAIPNNRCDHGKAPSDGIGTRAGRQNARENACRFAALSQLGFELITALL